MRLTWQASTEFLHLIKNVSKRCEHNHVSGDDFLMVLFITRKEKYFFVSFEGFVSALVLGRTN